MAHPFIVLGLIGLGVVGTEGYLVRKGSQDPELTPRIMGYDARYVMGGLGVTALVLGSFVPVFGPVLATIGAGMTIGAVSNTDTMSVVGRGLEAAVKRQIEGGGGGAPQLPGPVAPPLDAPEAPRGGGGGWLDSILNPAR